MADLKVKISEFPLATESKDTDDFAILQDGENKRIKSPKLEEKLLVKVSERYVNKNQLGVNNGVATLGADGILSVNQRPPFNVHANFVPINLLSEPSEVDGVFVPTESGVYENYGNIEIDLNDGTYIITKIGEQYEKSLLVVQSPKSVNTISELRSREGDFEGQIITLLGYYEAGDKEQLNYKWTSEQGIDDGGSVINTEDGSWLAVFGNSINVSDFGAKGDGSDDSSYIIRAGEAVIKYNSRSLSFDNKVYEIGKYSRTYNALILLNSNLKIQGNGCTLKLKNGVLLDGGDVKFLFADKDLSNIYIRDLTIDFNGVNNFVSGTIMNYSIAIGSLFNITNFTLENVVVKNNPARQTILLGNNSTNTIAKQVKIYNCSFYNVGNGIVGNEAQTDHSTLYIHGEDINIYKNSFINERNFIADGVIPTSSAIEVHSSNANVSENYVNNYRNVFNIVGGTKTQKNSIYANNICENIGKLVEFWSNDTNILDSIIISGNIAKQIYAYGMIDGYSHISSDCESIVISNNYFENTAPRSLIYSNPLLSFRRVKNLIFTDNYVKKIKSGVGHFTGSSDLDIHVDVNNNTFVDCGDTDSTSATMNHKGFLFNIGRFKSINIDSNKFISTNNSLTYINNMFHSDSGADIINVKNNDYKLSNPVITNNSATYGQINIIHNGVGVPRNSVRASAGSIFYDPESNIRWEKVNTGLYSSGWRKVAFATSAPTSGDFLAGDIAYNILPTASNKHEGWICISNGSPGVWQPFGGIGISQASASPDTATQATGATPTNSEFDALLAELRDVKTKLRTAGILAPNTT